MADEIDNVLEKLARDVEAAVHSMYRGDVRQATVKARTGNLIREAADALRARGTTSPEATAASAPPSASAVSPAAPPSGRPSAPVALGALLGWSPEEGQAVMKCVTAWLPMGSPANATPDSKCVAAGREMVPSWGERERARAALRRVSPA
jgi:hypothetical protein